jgi:hypothetical protein
MVRKQLGDETVLSIRRMHKQRMSTRQIAKLLGCSSPAVSYWCGVPHLPSDTKRAPPTRRAAPKRRRQLVRQLALKTVTKKAESGRTTLSRKVLVYPSLSSLRTALAAQFRFFVSKSTIRNDLKAMGFNNRVRRTVPSTSEAHIKKRAEFCNEMLRKPKKYMKKVVFSDEKIFTSNDGSCRTQWVPRGGRSLPRESTRYPAGRVHIFGVIGVGFKKIVIFPEKNSDGDPFRLTSEAYKRRCLQGIVGPLKLKGHVFQQDGAGAHRGAISYLLQKGLEIMSWPARSPQLSPIETWWALLQKKVAKHHPLTRAQLTRAIQVEAAKYPQRSINKLVMSFEKRCRDEVNQ